MDQKCVMVLDETLPLGLLWNTAAILGVTLGRQVPELVGQGVISGGMIPKVQCCVDAIEHGVRRTHILDGRIPHSILIEVLSHAGIGTMIW